MTPEIEPTQADRDLHLQLCDLFFPADGQDIDSAGISQALTRHAQAARAEGYEQAALIAEGHAISGNDQWCAGADYSARKIARAIRDAAKKVIKQ